MRGIDRLFEWLSNHPNHRADKAAWRRHVLLTRAADLRRPFAEVHAEAIAEHEARQRPRPPEPDYAAEMKLPEGKTCDHCWHVKRCRALGYTSSVDRTGCDFHPRRFVDAGFADDGWRQAALSALRERVAA